MTRSSSASASVPAPRQRRWAFLIALAGLLAAPLAAQPLAAQPLAAQPLATDAWGARLAPLAPEAWAAETPAAEDATAAREAAARDTSAAAPGEAARTVVAQEDALEGLDLFGDGPLADAADAALADPDTTDEKLRKRPVPLTVFGYYRGFFYARDITEPYPNLAPFERTYGFGDGYREPALSVSILGRPNGRSSFGTELFVFAPYDGFGTENNTVSLNLGVNFYGNFRTEVGNVGVRAGGVHWYNLSPFTIGVYQVLDRFSIFDRTPWEGVSGTAKYESYFETGQANPGDERWNFQAFQGLIVDGRQIPGGFQVDGFWGKTQPNGGLPNADLEVSGGPGDTPIYTGLSGDARTLPSFIGGGRIGKTFGRDALVALNSITSYRTLDSLDRDRRQYQVHTAQFDVTRAGVNLSGELGASLYESPEYDSPWGEALMARVKTARDLTALPLDLQVYQVGRHFFNENGEIATNNNPQIQADPRCDVPAGGGSAGGLITQVNQLAHNRRGVNFNTAFGAGPAKLAVGWGLAHELAPTTDEVSYIHRINGLAISRVYNPFPAEAVCATQFGPLGRQYSFFRGAFERVELTDVEPVTGLPTNRKYFHAVDLQAKLRARVLDRPLYLFYLASFGSANRSAQAVPRDDDTYVFVQYHEVDAYVEVLPGFLLAGYLGLENARGGRFTALDDETGEPRDQVASGVGVGFDWTLAPNAGLYLRHRWMDFEDRSFAEDTYAGVETTLELKIFF